MDCYAGLGEEAEERVVVAYVFGEAMDENQFSYGRSIRLEIKLVCIENDLRTGGVNGLSRFWYRGIENQSCGFLQFLCTSPMST